MIFEALALPGAHIVRLEPATDERGFFARVFCRNTFEQQGLNPDLTQCSISFNAARHTLRGMHLQRAPHEEAKLVRCTRGASHHVIVDLRPESTTYLDSAAVELSRESRDSLYVPQGVAHGFLTLEDDTEIFYMMTGDYEPAAARGVRWDDPAFGIQWPHKPAVISQRDATYPDFDDGMT